MCQIKQKIILTIVLIIIFRPMEFIECEDLVDLKGNKTRDDTMTGGCSKV